MIKRQLFAVLKPAQKDAVIADLMGAKFKGGDVERTQVFQLPEYALNVSALVTFLENEEIIKKIFVLLQEQNTHLSDLSIETLTGAIIDDLERDHLFNPEIDELWIVTSEQLEYKGYGFAKGRVILMDIDTLLDGIDKYYPKKDRKSTELRKTLMHFGIV